MSEEIESRARTMGWLPKEEFRGNPDNHVDAETFVRMAETSLPHLKGTLKTMERKMVEQDQLIRQQTGEVQDLKNTLTEFVEFSKGAEQRAYNRAVKELRAEQNKAKEAGDLPAFVEATEKLDAVIAEHPAITGKDKPLEASSIQAAHKPSSVDEEFKQWIAAEPAAFEDWKGENTWFDDEPDMAVYADQMDRFLIRKNGFKVKRSDHLKEVAKMVKKKFPEYFGNSARKGGSPVEGDSGGSPSGNGRRTYHDLPADVKAQCDKWTGKSGNGKTGTIKGFTRDEFVRNYKWD